MDSRKYIGMDVHQVSISIAVRDANGKLVMESVIETKAATILECIRGIRGNLWVAFEEGTSAAWLYDLLKPHVAKVVVCDPRKNALLKAGNKNDRVDARRVLVDGPSQRGEKIGCFGGDRKAAGLRYEAFTTLILRLRMF